MSEQATETPEIEIDTPEEIVELGEEAQAAESEEVEIITAGEEEPSSKPVRSGFKKRIDKLNSKIEAANTEADEARRELELAREENRLLSMKLQHGKPQGRPKPEDFDTDADYDKALGEYEAARVRQIVNAEREKDQRQQQQVNTQANYEARLRDGLVHHYERAEKFEVPDYEATEDAAIEVLGKDVAKQIMANTDESEKAMYILGKKPEKAAYYADLIKRNPIGGLVSLGRFIGETQIRRKSSPPPEPETELSGGTSTEFKGPAGATFE